MTFSPSFLSTLAQGKTQGNFPPFSTGNWEDTEVYLKQVVGRIRDIHTIVIEADFNHYGTGFSSHIPLELSKKDKNDVSISINGAFRTEETQGLILYLCRLAPYAVYGAGTWSVTYKNEEWDSEFRHFLEPSIIDSLPETDWQHELRQIQDILHQYGIRILSKVEIAQKLDFELHIPTVLSDPPYTVFDCFFYWAD